MRSAQPIVLSHPTLRRLQQRHALLTTALPPLLTVPAVLLTHYTGGIGVIALASFSAMYALSMIGITVGYHRLFSHRAFHVPRALEHVLIVMGSFMGQGPMLYWVANHRRHHAFADGPEDAHSPHHHGPRALGLWAGLWHAQVAWPYRHATTNVGRFATDLLRQRALCRTSSRYYLWLGLGLIAPAVVAGLISLSPRAALHGLLWGGVVRLAVTYQISLAVGSLGHRIGSRPFALDDHSTNLPLLGLLTFGEGWHNNHHALPGVANFGLRWWQVDVGALLIRALELFGFATEVRWGTYERARLATGSHSDVSPDMATQAGSDGGML